MTILLFDVGNVIVEANHSITSRKLCSYGVSRDNAQLFFKNEDYLQFSRGKISGEEFYRALIEKYLKSPLSYEQVKGAHNDHLYGLNKDVVAILDSLPKSGLAFATNTNEWQTEKERRLIDLRRYSRQIFRSNEIQMLKSDDGCFQYIAEQLNAKPSEIIFVDDNLENIIKANKVGLQTIQFFNSVQLSKDLERKGAFLL